MANSEPVRVAVEIIDKFSDDLKELEAWLEKIDGKTLNVDLDIDDGRLEEIEARLEKLEEDINATLKFKTRGYGKAKAQKEDLEGDMFSTLHLGVDKDQLRGLGNLNGGEGFNPPGKGSGLAGLTGLEGLDLADDVFDHTLENLRGFEGSSGDYADSVRRFSPEEQEAVNDWLINPAVAKAHNRGIPAKDRDGWIGPSNWDFGIGEKWGPEPRYLGDKKRLDPATDFLRGVKEMTDSLDELEGVGPNIDPDDYSFPLKTGLGDPDSNRNAAEIDFLRSINRATGNIDVGEAIFNGGRFGDLDFQASGFDPGLFFPDGSRGNYSWSIPQRVGRRTGRAYGRARAGVNGLFTRARGAMPSGAELDTSNFFANRQFKGIGDTLKKILPTNMAKWYKLVALMLPLLIALAGAAMGVVAAFGALAVAGVAMGGIGLLGWGDSLEESLRNVQREIGNLKKELFSVLRPAANAFQPFTAQLFDGLPRMVDRLVEPLQGLTDTGYDIWWLESLEGTSQWLSDLLWAASDLAPQIQAIGTAFGAAFGDWLIGFLIRMTNEVYENWEMWTKLTRSFLSIINLIYELAKVVAFVVALLEPFLTFIGRLAEYLGNDLLVALLAAIAAMWALDFALAAVAAKAGFATFAAMASSLYAAATAGGVLNGVLAWTAGILDTIIAKATLANILTGGVLLAAGAVVGYGAYRSLKSDSTASDALGGRNVPASRGSGMGPAPAGAGGGTQINIYGNVGHSEYQRLKDEFPTLYGEQAEIDEKTTK
ncbi:hypothetical protein [Halorubrum halodurans]|uniref:Uncharacterized protein n=1 Tax=Halorubrum halodurans TaxID=1383851 RepID=A0A256IEL3_9EURY|nr:hypothetical protein [Halorubrum halodurans]OYR54913.1 hypothetical protein DJ70_12855 [Halorubrum halodurans]